MRVFKQVSRFLGSIGHGAFRLRHCNTPPMNIKPLLSTNIASLCSLIDTIAGKTATNEASVAPAPKPDCMKQLPQDSIEAEDAHNQRQLKTWRSHKLN